MKHQGLTELLSLAYVGQYFGLSPFLKFLQIYAECNLEVRQLPDPILAYACNTLETLIPETALKMLKRGKLTIEEIAEDSGLSVEEVKQLSTLQAV